METTPSRDSVEGWPKSLRRPGDRLEFARRIGLIGQSVAIQQTAVSVAQIAPTSSTVLITGETGTGKEVVARGIHQVSPRRNQPFYALNISALNEGTVESELFGHEKGAFTDAVREKKGIFEAAGRGTVLLDEIGDISPAMQVKLLRVLEEREFKRVGSTEMLRTDARVITATNRNLVHLTDEGRFRDDLYYRLRVFEIHLPPLRERKEDVPPLVEHFIERYCAENDRRVPHVNNEAMELFLAYDWPGNVRELRTVVERMMVMAEDPVIDAGKVPDVLRERVHRNRLLPALRRPQAEQERFELGVIYRALIELRSEVGELRKVLTEYAEGKAQPSWSASSLREADRPHAQQEQNVVDIELAEEESHAAESQKPVGNLRDLEREAIRRTLAEVNGNRREAARALGIGERTLYRKLKEYALA